MESFDKKLDSQSMELKEFSKTQMNHKFLERNRKNGTKIGRNDFNLQNTYT